MLTRFGWASPAVPLAFAVLTAIPCLLPAVEPPGTTPGRPGAESLVVDRSIRLKIERARELKALNRSDDAVHLLRDVLQAADDSFVLAPEERDGKKTMRFVPARAEAERLLADLVQSASFAESFETPAQEQLAEARKKDDCEPLANIVRRYPLTKAEAEALQELAARYYDAGNLREAALLFRRLQPRHDAVTWNAALTFRESVAFRYLDANEPADAFWRRMEALVGDSSLNLKGRELTFAQAVDNAKKLLEKKPASTSSDWRVHGGSPDRQFVGDRSAPAEPLLDWVRPTVAAPESLQVLDECRRAANRDGLASLPGAFPLALNVDLRGKATDMIVYSSWYGVHAVDLATGAQVWETSSQFAPDVLMQT